MRAILFQRQFRAPILAGIKITTWRRPWKNGRFYREGEDLSLRCWSGAPYRSKQELFATARVRFVIPVTVSRRGVHRTDDGNAMDRRQVARREGFRNWTEMRQWFETHHGLPAVLRMVVMEEVQPYDEPAKV